MDIGSIVAIAALNIALLTWLRSDMNSFHLEVRSWKEEINKEMKDFHGRLCSLEERMKENKW